MRTKDEQFNESRRKLLIKIDSKQYEDLRPLDLGYFGLTTYLDRLDSTRDIKMCDFYYRYLNKKYIIEHLGGNLTFMPIQKEALDFLKQNKKSILMAPTSFGKTLIVKEYIYVNKFNTVVYIVPTNALAYELQKSFKENDAFGDYTMFDKIGKGGSDGIKTKILFVGTQEKFLEVKEQIPFIDLAIIDEAYKLADPIENTRCYKLSKSFLDMINGYDCRIILLTPNAHLNGFGAYSFHKFSTTFNAVDKDYSVVDNDTFYSLLNAKKEDEKTILFCKTPDDISKVADKITCKKIGIDRFAKQVIEDFHEDWTVAKLLAKGILTHDGVMPKYLQNKMLSLFNNENSKYKMMIGTNSISEGINTPTKNLFLHPSCNEIDNLLLIKNTIGRAGRLGKYPIGHIYSTINYENKIKEECNLEVSVFTEEGSKEISDASDENKIAEFCQNHSINKELYEKLMNKYHFSRSRLGTILNVLREKDYLNNSFSSIVWIAYQCNKNRISEKYYLHEAKKDSLLIRTLLQQYYYKDIRIVDGKKEYTNQIPINNYTQRIEFFRCLLARHNDDTALTNSEIMDSLIKLNYSTLDYTCYPIALIAKDIYENIPKWPFGKNVIEIIKAFLQRYHTFAFGIDDYESLDENEIAVLLSLKELGLNINAINIGKEMVDEIIVELDSRYSMYDIVNALKRLSKNSKHKKTYNEIINRYLDYAL